MFANAILQNVSLEVLNSWIPAAIGQYYVIDSSHSGQNGGEIKEDNVRFRQFHNWMRLWLVCHWSHVWYITLR